jgi:hypothetical protein
MQDPVENSCIPMTGLSEQIPNHSTADGNELEGGERCVLCGRPEDIDHLIFYCSMAKFVWSFLGEVLGWQGYPRDMDDLVANWLPGGFNVSYQTGLACFAGIAWVIWLT